MWTSHFQSDTQPLKVCNATQCAFPQDQSLPQLFEAQASATPGAIALEAGSERLTYGELATHSNQLAHCLQLLGVGPDVPVGLCLDRSLKFVVGALGILKAGGAYLPLDPAYPPGRLAFMLNDAQAPVIITKQGMAERLPSGPWRVVTLDSDGPEISSQGLNAPLGGARAENLAYVIYTSGSTGQAKGVEITHRSLVNLIFWHRRAFRVGPADRATQLASPGFDAAVWELWPYLTAGASVHLPDETTRVTPELLRDWLIARSITISFAPTALAEQLLQLEWPLRLPLRILLTGADTLHHYPSSALPFILVNNYGPTECTVVATSGVVPPVLSASATPSVGRPIDNTQVYILAADSKTVPMGEPGELHIGGLGLARGYRNRPDLTAQKFIPDPFRREPGARLYKTGDLARYLPDGQIEFLGRIDEQIKIRGYRIEPNEIVAVLDRHPSVRASVVTARDDERGDKHLVAYLVPAPATRPAPSVLREFLNSCLPEYMIPTVFVEMEALPLTPNGKVDRAALPAPDTAHTLCDATNVLLRTPTEEQVAGIIGALLGVQQVGATDNFFLLGGHSLLGAQVISRVRSKFNIELTQRSLFNNPTVAGLCREIDRLMVAKKRGSATPVPTTSQKDDLR